MEDTQVIKFDDSVSAQALTDLQEHVKLLPAVIATESEFKTIYKNYQNVRRLRIAVGKQSEDFIRIAKMDFEGIRGGIKGKELAVLTILEPIESKLKSTREDWETKKRELAEIEAAKLAAEQEKEFNRTDIIRNWDQAHLENQAHDQKILDDIEREKKDKELKAETARLKNEKEDLAARELEFKIKVDEFEAYKMDDDFEKSKNDLNEILDPMLGKLSNSGEGEEEHQCEIIKPTEKGLEAMERKGVKIRDKHVGNAIILKPVTVLLIYSLDIVCPHCKKDYDLCDQEYDNEYSTPIFSNKWDEIKGMEAECPFCQKKAVIKEVEY